MKKYLISPPTLCPDCRQQRRLSFRNERKLYKRKCDAEGFPMISMYSPNKPYTIYEREEWWSDKWDPLSYGRNFDFSRGFFEQFDELMHVVPHASMNMANDNINSEYTTYSVSNKNVYMSFGPTENEDCAYGKFINQCVDCVDCLSTHKCRNCYEGDNSINCYHCHYFTDSTDCDHCTMIEDCKGCKYCIGCVGLRNKEYYGFNEYIGKDRYEELMATLPEDMKWLKNIFLDLKALVVRPYTHIQNSENCTGDVLMHCNTCFDCFDLVNSEFCKYSWYNKNSTWSYDSVFNDPTGIRYCYETCSTLWENIAFCFFVLESNNVLYSVECFWSDHLFGCIGLKNKSYCILNKQYTREEYEALVPKIIEHMMNSPLTPLDWVGKSEAKGGVEWGEFFPSSLSPFGYNETVAMEYYPLDRRDVSEKHLYQNGTQIFNWSDYEAPFPKVEKIIPADKLPDNISKIPDDILNCAIECEITKKPFRIIRQELDFYRKHNLPIPRKHPDQRHLDRMALRNPRKLFERKCDKCGVEMVTTYSPERKEVVYCEKCYEKEMY